MKWQKLEARLVALGQAARKENSNIQAQRVISIFSTEGKSGTELRRVAKTHANRHYPPSGGGSKAARLAAIYLGGEITAGRTPLHKRAMPRPSGPWHRVSSGRIQAEAAKMGWHPSCRCPG